MKGLTRAQMATRVRIFALKHYGTLQAASIANGGTPGYLSRCCRLERPMPKWILDEMGFEMRQEDLYFKAQKETEDDQV